MELSKKNAESVLNVTAEKYVLPLAALHGKGTAPAVDRAGNEVADGDRSRGSQELPDPVIESHDIDAPLLRELQE